MSIVILGAKGMLGSALVEALSRDHDVVGRDKDELDITDEAVVRRAFAEMRPGIVVNAAAYTDVDGAENDEAAATRVNGEAVGILARACIDSGAVFVHYSTDYVFDGLDARGYDEDAEPTTPINAYGRSKLAGERAMLTAYGLRPTARYYLIRTSWLYGAHGKNFVDAMLKLGREPLNPAREKRDAVKVVDDQWGKPTYTHDLAHTTREILEAEEEHESGIYHVTNETPDGGITWCDFAKEIFRQAGMDVAVTPCASAEYPRPAKRPTYSMLVNTKLFSRRFWSEALAEYLQGYVLRS